MHIVLSHFRILLFLVIIVNSLFACNVNAQPELYFTQNDSILINYFEALTKNEIEYEKIDSIDNIQDFNLGPLYDTLHIEIDSLSYDEQSNNEVTQVRFYRIEKSYRREIIFHQLNDSLYIGFAMNIFRRNLLQKLHEVITFDINFFVFNIYSQNVYIFISYGKNDYSNGNLLIKDAILYAGLCRVYNSKKQLSREIRLRKNNYNIPKEADALTLSNYSNIMQFMEYFKAIIKF